MVVSGAHVVRIQVRQPVLDGVELHPLQGLDCQFKCNRQIEKGLIWGTKAETLSGTVVQTFRNPQNIAVPNLPEVDPLGQIARE